MPDDSKVKVFTVFELIIDGVDQVDTNQFIQFSQNRGLRELQTEKTQYFEIDSKDYEGQTVVINQVSYVFYSD